MTSLCKSSSVPAPRTVCHSSSHPCVLWETSGWNELSSLGDTAALNDGNTPLKGCSSSLMLGTVGQGDKDLALPGLPLFLNHLLYSVTPSTPAKVDTSLRCFWESDCLGARPLVAFHLEGPSPGAQIPVSTKWKNLSPACSKYYRQALPESAMRSQLLGKFQCFKISCTSVWRFLLFWKWLSRMWK